jgi:hypothetical protein
MFYEALLYQVEAKVISDHGSAILKILDFCWRKTMILKIYFGDGKFRNWEKS